MTETHATIERAVRNSWGRLVAFLSVRTGDLAAAEDSLADAFRDAMETWPEVGVPKKPEAWLLVVARRRLTDAARRQRVQDQAVPELTAITETAQHIADSSDIFPDERLKLLFVCAHPAIDISARTPLMLQVVLGLDAARIASAFLVKPSAMGQRLSRAKTKIRLAGIRFEVPESADLQPRLEAVLDGVYAAYGSGWDDVTGADPRRQGLSKEAINLGRLLSQLMPDEPEVLGLLALMLHCEARSGARLTPGGVYVPLSEQDVSRWSGALIEEAEESLSRAARIGRIGQFQLEAAIQSAHAQRMRTGGTDWEAITLLYEGLVRLSPSTGALVARAAAASAARGAAAGWVLLEAIPIERVQNYQTYWAVAAHLLHQLQRKEEAQAAYIRAIGLCENRALRDFLTRKAAPLDAEAFLAATRLTKAKHREE